MSTVALIERLFPPSEGINLRVAVEMAEWATSPVRKRRRLNLDQRCTLKADTHNLSNATDLNSASASTFKHDEGSVVDYEQWLIQDCSEWADLVRKDSINDAARSDACLLEASHENRSRSTVSSEPETNSTEDAEIIFQKAFGMIWACNGHITGRRSPTSKYHSSECNRSKSLLSQSAPPNKLRFARRLSPTGQGLNVDTGRYYSQVTKPVDISNATHLSQTLLDNQRITLHEKKMLQGLLPGGPAAEFEQFPQPQEDQDGDDATKLYRGFVINVHDSDEDEDSDFENNDDMITFFDFENASDNSSKNPQFRTTVFT